MIRQNFGSNVRAELLTAGSPPAEEEAGTNINSADSPQDPSTTTESSTRKVPLEGPHLHHTLQSAAAGLLQSPMPAGVDPAGSPVPLRSGKQAGPAQLPPMVSSSLLKNESSRSALKMGE